MTPLERFEAKYIPEPNSGCWLWAAAISTRYPRFKPNGQMYRAHRWAYEHFVGPIPEGLEIDHLCGVPICVNPNHLEPVTRQENLARHRERLGGSADACMRGHPFEGYNLIIERDRHLIKRRCRICGNLRARARRAKAREGG